MICTNVVTCLSHGLAKTNKIMSMFVKFSRHFWTFRRVSFSKLSGQTLHHGSLRVSFWSTFPWPANSGTILRKS